MTLTELNTLHEDQARVQLATCCVANGWLDGVLAERPFDNTQALLDSADAVWQRATQSDILEAFEGHPRIGDVSTLKKKFAHTASLAGHEQSGMNAADDAVLQRMAELNDAYYAKFGYIFIVCATGKSATEMLALLEARLPNDPATELRIAAAEQGKITRLRLQKLVSE
ncbi:MAG: 2-oxo-4-hydroxy-4-carboxy-5-ureidoimidazoline decarboxylase [Reinekea sp.]|jgi:2-oxo-4-hydroxy-4-carboxy-5-ureidoimidazoline decarboxylase|nr:2-oxo-4-hydroxy-4-carboxy-5-ureidoimidazoline decarboxylase [Reinekea sp.]